MAWPPPELDEGAEPELKPLELEPLLLLLLLSFEFEPVEPVELEPDELEPDEVEPDEVEPDEVEPEPEDEPDPEPADVPVDDEPDDVPVDDEPDDVEEASVLCADPGRVSATMPAAATLAMVTVVVADRTLARPRSLSAMARRTRSRCALLMGPILRSHARNSSARTFSVGYETDGLPRRPWPDVTQAT